MSNPNTNRTAARVPFVVFLGLVAVLIAILFLAGCGKSVVESAPQPAPDVVASEPTEEPAPRPTLDTRYTAFGGTYTWEDGISMTVGEPQEFEPTGIAAGMVEGNVSLWLPITITNDSGEPFSPSAFASVSSGGMEAKGIFDTGHELALSGPPSTSILPGQSVTYNVGISVADPAHITFELSPSFSHDDAIWTNIAP